MEQIHLCLSDLLGQDLSAYEYFQTLPPAVQTALYDREITSFQELQESAQRLKHSPFL